MSRVRPQPQQDIYPQQARGYLSGSCLARGGLQGLGKGAGLEGKFSKHNAAKRFQANLRAVEDEMERQNVAKRHGRTHEFLLKMAQEYIFLLALVASRGVNVLHSSRNEISESIITATRRFGVTQKGNQHSTTFVGVPSDDELLRIRQATAIEPCTREQEGLRRDALAAAAEAENVRRQADAKRAGIAAARTNKRPRRDSQPQAAARKEAAARAAAETIGVQAAARAARAARVGAAAAPAVPAAPAAPAAAAAAAVEGQDVATPARKYVRIDFSVGPIDRERVAELERLVQDTLGQGDFAEATLRSSRIVPMRANAVI